MDSMDLFHVSDEEYNVGKIIRIDDFSGSTKHHQEAEKKEMGWINIYLDSLKPQNAPSRVKVIYAFGNFNNCAAYAGTVRINSFYYRVRMKNPIACPMCLAHKLHKLRKCSTENNEIFTKVAKEYWQPVNYWKYLEYLSEEMEILEILTPPDDNQIRAGHFAYLDDIDLSNKLFK